MGSVKRLIRERPECLAVCLKPVIDCFTFEPVMLTVAVFIAHLEQLFRPDKDNGIGECLQWIICVPGRPLAASCYATFPVGRCHPAILSKMVMHICPFHSANLGIFSMP